MHIVHVLALTASFAVCLILGVVTFGLDRKWLLIIAETWVAGLVIAMCFVLEAPLHMQYDDYQHYDYIYWTHHASEGVPSDVAEQIEKMEWGKNDFIFAPVLKVLGYSYDNLFFFMKFLYILMAPLAMMCAWLLFKDAFAARATGLMFLTCPLLIRYAGSVTLTFPALGMYLLSVLLLLLFIDRRNPAYIILSVPILLIITKTKSEHALFIPSYILLAWAAVKTAPRPGQGKGNLSMAIIVAVFIGWMILFRLLIKPTEAQSAEPAFAFIGTYAQRIRLGYSFGGFIRQELEYIGINALFIPPVLFVKIMAVWAWRSEKHRPVILALAAQFLFFFAIYAVSFVVRTLEQFRYALLACFPFYVCAGLGFSMLRERKKAFLIFSALTAGILAYHYSLIPTFKTTGKYHEYSFLKETLPKISDCTVLYARLDFADMSPNYPLWALGNPENIISIQSVLRPESALSRTLMLYNKHRTAVSYLLPKENTQWVRTGSLQDFLYSLRSRKLLMESIDQQAFANFMYIKSYIDEFGAKLPTETDPDRVWDNRFTDSLERGECYYFYFSRTDSLAQGREGEPFSFIRPYFKFGESYRSGPWPKKRRTLSSYIYDETGQTREGRDVMLTRIKGLRDVTSR